jgi:hypothetical protein
MLIQSRNLEFQMSTTIDFGFRIVRASSPSGSTADGSKVGSDGAIQIEKVSKNFPFLQVFQLPSWTSEPFEAFDIQIGVKDRKIVRLRGI